MSLACRQMTVADPGFGKRGFHIRSGVGQGEASMRAAVKRAAISRV